MNNLGNDLYSDLTKKQLLDILFKRLDSFFVINNYEKQLLADLHDQVLNRCKICFSDVDNKYFRKEQRIWFSNTHSGQYLTYLYFFSNELNSKNEDLSSKLYYLNKIMHSVDILGAVKLPESFFFEHPMGLVLGRAIYKNGFMAMQSCTVGGNYEKSSSNNSKLINYPSLGFNLKMYSNSKIIGKSNIGDNVIVAANTYIKDKDIESNSLVFGQSPNLIIKKLVNLE